MAKSQLTTGLVTGRLSGSIRMGVNPAISADLKSTEAKKILAVHETAGVARSGVRSGPAQPTNRTAGKKVARATRVGGGGI